MAFKIVRRSSIFPRQNSFPLSGFVGGNASDWLLYFFMARIICIKEARDEKQISITHEQNDS